jgi:flagellar M-ring protein FliF
MNFLNHAIAQVSDLFRSMTPGARITAGLLLAVVVVSLSYLFRQGAAGPDAFLFGGQAFSDGQLTKMEAALGQANVTGWMREGNRLRVPAGQQASAIAAIADAGALPANFNTVLEDTLNKGNWWETHLYSKERIKDGRQRQLSEIVRAMSWVEDAVVIIDEEEPKGFSRQRQITASVSVKPAGGQPLDPVRAINLKKFIAGCIAGMSPNSVVVTNLDGGEFGANTSPELFEDQPYYKAKILYEQSKRESILSVLKDIPGVRVEVNAQLDVIASETSASAKRDSKNQATLRETDVQESSSQIVPDTGGRVGAVANSAVGPSQATVADAQRQTGSQTSSKTLDTEYVPGEERQILTKAPFTPEEVLATVAVPTSYFVDVWRARNPNATEPPKPEDLAPIKSEITTNIENAVEPLIVKSADRIRDTVQRVQVIALDSLPQPEIELPSIASQALAWTGRYWNTIAMLGVAMFSLMVMRSVVKGAPANPAPEATASSSPHTPTLSLATEDVAPHAEPASAEGSEQRQRLRLKKGTTVKDDLIEIVREDPDAAADILRSWIGKAG